MEEIVFCGENNQAVTTSLMVAEVFEKNHDNVLKVIRKILQEGIVKNDETPMFEETTYVNEQNKQSYPMFFMNRDGFTLLAMGFTGKKAMEFKLEYIKAFNKMEAIIKEQTKPKSQAEMLLEQCKLMVEQEHRLQKVEQRLDKMDEERIENGKLLLEAEVSKNKVPEISMRNKIRRLVNQYAAATNTPQKDIWHDIIITSTTHTISVLIATRRKNRKAVSMLLKNMASLARCSILCPEWLRV